MLLAAASVAAAYLATSLYFGIFNTFLVSLTLLLLYGIVFHPRWVYVAAKTAPRDIRAVGCYIKILWLTRQLTKKNWTMPDIFHDTVKRHPDKPCFLFHDEVWTFKQVEDFSLRVTAVLKAQGYKKGSVVGLLVNNSPQLPALWLGNARLGHVTPLINTNQRGSALIHSINVAKCDVVIYSDEFQSAIQDIAKDLSPSVKLFKFSHRPLNPGSKAGGGVGDQVEDFTSLLEKTAPAPWTLADGEGFHGKLMYIYTSGTTGLPKAAVISSSRMVFMASGIHYLGGLNSSDVVYCPLPLYHTAGGIISVGQAFIFGCTVALKPKFSASQYFPDCIKYKATVAHYIGEMCRYVLATPPSPADTQHSVRVVYGNGMRPQIWNEFVKRFNIQHVAEFYGATEGNANIVNIDGKPGAIGFVSRIIPQVYPIAIIKVDQQGEPVRDSQGLCQLAEAEEPGVFIGKISPNNPARAFLGYVDKAASEKKLVRDVFKHGDSAFISGDIIVSDEFGYLYFKDRTGDTFRWRGENVSTTEVEAAVSRQAAHRDAAVYGVLVPNTEGRAGMCGIVDEDNSLDLDKLASDLAKDLPAYARPIFLRVMPKLDMTGTFKMKKTDLQKEGFDPNIVKDKLYYLDAKLNRYLPLGPQEYEKINNGQIRL
ncbi:hypothetical protein JYU34_002710 [Plutella xylostella]|uniref:Long-chain-fatty-acid--CoA ligase n=1 Tax=Plutella xylostella TaxID=51655 RepID=A0ABQ7R2Z4_PLUXY|nr:hypothetical protein JYU34_002710 [Plutella xylostella]